MEVRSFGRRVLGAGIAGFLLAGCGGQATDSTVPRAAPTVRTAAHRFTGSSGDLLYVVMTRKTDVLTYPGYKRVGTLPYGSIYATSNPNTGDVLFDGGNVYEYAHGGSQPIAVIPPPSGVYTVDSAFDPTTSDIAIVYESTSGGYVDVYQTPSGTPTTYSDPNIPYPWFVGYDAQGDLFIDGAANSHEGCCRNLAELPKGGSTFTDITLNEGLDRMASIQWDGSYIAVTNGTYIYRLSISGSSGTVVGDTPLSGAWGRPRNFWIQGDTVVGPHVSPPHNGRYLGFWHYPQGGAAYKTITSLSTGQKDRVASVTISVGGSRK